jgi:hypothetical protein
MQRMTQQQASSEAMTRAMAGGPDLSAAQMINLQLHTQEQGKVQWHGVAWPGQPMQWDVEREQNEGRSRGRGEPDEPPVWRSGARFSFPLLGKVAASITLVGDQVHVAMQSGTDETAAELRAWSGMLQRALEADGAPLASLKIDSDAGPGTGADAGPAMATAGAAPDEGDDDAS